MERAQNGVNGNTPQQSYGYIPTSYQINNQIQRVNPSNMFPYEGMQQMCLRAYTPTIQSSATPLFIRPQFVMSSQIVPQGFPSNMQHNVGYQLRPMLPAQPFMNQYQQPNYNIIQSFNPFQTYPQHFQQPFGYQQEVPPQPAKPVINSQTQRKFSPLVVVDPASNTGVDLTRYQTNSEKQLNNNPLQIPDLILDKKIVDKDETNQPKEMTRKYVNEKENLNKHGDYLKQDIIEQSIKIINKQFISKTEHPISDIKDEKDVPTLSIYFEREDSIEIDKQNKKPDISVDVKEEDNIVNITEESDIFCASENAEFIDKLKLPEVNSVLKSDEEEMIAGSSEEEIPHIESKANLLNYRLPINKKESDETTLKRKLIYDRAYLIKFKDIGKSLEKPINMSSTSDFSDIISNTPRITSCLLPDSSSNQVNADKNSIKKSVNRQYSAAGQIYKKQGYGRMQKCITLDNSENQGFVRSKSGYLPPQFRDKQKEIDHQTELKRNIKGNLNKITPQNFQDCLAEIQKLNIEDKDEMSCLINEIFIKAVKEEAYSVTYAQFCNRLSCMYVDNQTFKSQLLKKCQDMFETPLQDQLSTVRNEWELKITNETDLKMKTLYESDLEEQVKKAKDKYFGNIRFIGELFLHSLLAAKVILNCITELLNGSDDSDAMLALCKLLETCGKQIDTKHKEQMNTFIGKINDLSQSKELEKRIRFKLRDIVDMRARDWTLRHVQQEKKINPQTIQEQKEEAAAEASAAATKFAAMTKKRNPHNTPNNARRNVPTPSAGPLSIKKLTCNSQMVDEKTVLGPTRSNWIVGSGTKAKPHEVDGWIPVSMQKPKNVVGNRYTSNSRSREQSPQVMIQNKYRTLESSAEASGADSRSSTPPLNPPFSRAYRVHEPEIVITDDERSDIIFSDLLSTGQFDVSSWVQLRLVKPVIEKYVDDMMEKDATCRRCIGDSFNKLLIDNKMSTDQIVEGTQAFVASIEDLICDIPKLWEFFGQFLERFIYDKNSNISFFESIFKPILPDANVAQCFSLALHEASSRLGHNIVGQVFHKSLKWSSIVPKDWESFVKTNNLEFTITGGAPLSPCGGDPLHYIAEELDDMLSNNSSNENIFDFLEKHVDKPTWKKSECTKTITSSILKAIKMMPSDNSVREYLKCKKEIIKRISNHKVDNEIEILKAILHISGDLKKSTLILIYDLIFTESIVSERALELYLNNSSLQSENNFKLTKTIISQLNNVNEQR